MIFPDQPDYSDPALYRVRLTPLQVSLAYAAGGHNTRRSLDAMLQSQHDQMTRWLFPQSHDRHDDGDDDDHDDGRYDHLFLQR